ncbi:MAG: hypothetical protein K2N87_18840 [Eubacterium sp.]|nr:hypothetical protein [Eubacterium sp.]
MKMQVFYAIVMNNAGLNGKTIQKKIEKDSLVWNFISSILFGFQSVMMLMVLTRTAGLKEAGIFTIAYANASLFLLIGKYGVRNYQVSDLHREHTFGDYQAARWISTAAMAVCSILYIFWKSKASHYTFYKSLAILLVCLYKVPDAVEDVYFGEYQRNGRLDIAAKVMSARLFFSILSFAWFAVITRHMLYALVASIIFSFVLLWVLLKRTVSAFHLKKDVRWESVKKILRNCFPLFAGSFLMQYISSVPKYAIDSILNDKLQACYGFLSMPVFVISLLSNVIFAPVIYKMTEYWGQQNRRYFIRRIWMQVAVITGIMAMCLAGAYFLGIPALSFLYHTDLGQYKKELMILLAGGGFLSLSGLLNIIMTIMRLQYTLLGGQVAVITGIMAMCLAGAYFLGIPVLSFLYHTNLGQYNKELMILLAGGGFLSLSGLLNIIMTIMRLQYTLLVGYVFVAFIALISAKRIVMFYGITGAACLYTGLMGTLCLVFWIAFIVNLK